MKKRIFTIFISLVYLFSLIPVNAKTNSNLLNEVEQLEKLTATKESIKDKNKVGEYDITITMPGNEEKISGSNFLFVMDASYSTDNEWKKMREAVLETVDLLLSPNETISDKSIINRVALMTFGVGEHLIIPFTQDKNLFTETLKVDIGGTLLNPGRSATNNEVGLKGAYNYLKSYAQQMEQVGIEVNKDNTFVIYLSDGNSNLNEKSTNFYKLSQERYLADQREYLYNGYYVATQYEDVEVNEVILANIDAIKDLYISIKGSSISKDELDLITINNEIGSTKEFIDLLNSQIANLYKEIGYDFTKGEYSASEYERLVNNFEFSNNKTVQTCLEDMFYIPISAIGSDRIENANRTIEAGLKLREISHVYTIGFNAWRADAGKIMDPFFEGGKFNNQTFEPNYVLDNNGNKITTHFSEGYYSSNASTIKLYLKKLSDNIIYRGYKNIVIVDYTSKWVIPMDINGDLKFDEQDIVVKNGDNLVNNNLIKVEKLTKEEIESLNDPELNNNKNKDIYRITFTLEDKITTSDKYTITYRVKVDTQEENFIGGKEYAANGKTTLTYDEFEFEYKIDDNNNIEVSEEIISNNEYDIVVPSVKQEENIVIIKKTDGSNLLQGADFDLMQGDGVNQVKKYYSNDGSVWNTTNKDNNATYFKFTGLYDYKYSFKETRTPDKYQTITDNISFDFTNLENEEETKEIINQKQQGKVIIHYVIKIDDTYISLSEYALDSEGNIIPEFSSIDIDDIILTGDIDSKYTTIYRDINNYNFIGLYRGNILENNDIEKLIGTKVSSEFINEIQEYTYVYSPSLGDGEIEPPQTGLELNINFLNIFNLISIAIFLKLKLI